jgi:glycosyltransferase involved in cell wall biosynthesis
MNPDLSVSPASATRERPAATVPEAARHERVAVIIPTYNEEKYIARCLDSLLTNGYDHNLLEIVVVDGRSTDRTREIVAAYSRQYSFIRLLDNPRRIQQTALNLGIAATTSEIVLRIDAHSIYEPTYISRLVGGLERYQADNVGGLRETSLGEGPRAKAFGIIISHPFASGNAAWRTGAGEPREVETVFCGCFRREVFERIGYFNENLIRAEDREFNARLRAAGGKVVLDPAVKCTYFPRTRFDAYARWNWSGGFWVVYSRRFTTTRMLLPRNLIPLAFVLWHLVMLIGLLLNPVLGLVLSLPVILYWLLAAWFALQAGLRHHDLRIAPFLFVLFPLTHYGYGLGMLAGLAMLALHGTQREA